jgi:hypothetical protein
MTGARSSALGWGIVAVLVSGWLALVEVFWLPLRIGGVLVPLSVVAAVVGNLMLTAAAHRLSGSRVVGVLPALVWLVVAVAAMLRTSEGDLVLTGGGATGTINLAFLLLGVTAAAFGVGRALAGPRRPAVRPGTDAAPPDDGAMPSAPAGSGSGGAR